MSKYKSKVDPIPIGETNGRIERIASVGKNAVLYLDHTTSPSSYFYSSGITSCYITDRQAKELLTTQLRCPQCGNRITAKESRFGVFYGCSSWPRCDIIWNEYGFSDQSMRDARKEAHAAFDPLWKDKPRIYRTRLYAELAKFLGIGGKRCHIQAFDEYQCDMVLQFVEDGRHNV